MGANLEVHGEGGCTGGGVVGVDCAGGVDDDGTRGFKERNNEDLVFQAIVPVGTAIEVVPATIVSGDHGCVSGVAVESFGRGAVPVDQLILGDVGVRRGGASFVS